MEKSDECSSSQSITPQPASAITPHAYIVSSSPDTRSIAADTPRKSRRWDTIPEAETRPLFERSGTSRGFLDRSSFKKPQASAGKVEKHGQGQKRPGDPYGAPGLRGVNASSPTVPGGPPLLFTSASKPEGFGINSAQHLQAQNKINTCSDGEGSGSAPKKAEQKLLTMLQQPPKKNEGEEHTGNGHANAGEASEEQGDVQYGGKGGLPGGVPPVKGNVDANSAQGGPHETDNESSEDVDDDMYVEYTHASFGL